MWMDGIPAVHEPASRQPVSGPPARLVEIPDKRTVEMDRLHLRQLNPFLRDRRLDEIDMDTLWPFIHTRRERDGVVNATINWALEVVRRILNLAQ